MKYKSKIILLLAAAICIQQSVTAQTSNQDGQVQLNSITPINVGENNNGGNQILRYTSNNNRSITQAQSQSPQSHQGNGNRESQQERGRQAQKDNSTTTTVVIFVLGRSGSGVSSTIRELLGPDTKCQNNGETKATLRDIAVYTIKNLPSPPDQKFRLRIVDIPGFIDGKTIDQESQILASLKQIVNKNGPPDFYLALSRFDDNRIAGEHSLFVQFLKRIELFQKVYLDHIKTSYLEQPNILFLLTRLMSETRINQRRPQEKMANFQRIIQQYTSLPSPATILVGENMAVAEYEAEVENGYYKLPNRQLYPKNIWEAFLNVSSISTMQRELLTAMMNSRESEMKCETKLFSTDWKYYEDDADAFLYLLEQGNYTVEHKEVNARLDEMFNSKNKAKRDMVMKIALQVSLQNENITTVDQIPKNFSDRAAFFRNSKLFSATVPALLLNRTFGLEMPEYIQSLSVGYGYVLLADELSPVSPFKTNTLEPSPIGYQIPNFMQCRKYISPEEEYFKSYTENATDYFQERMSYLTFPDKETMTDGKFTGKYKEGFNVKPDDNDIVVLLTAIEEVRILTCRISDPENWELTEEFSQAVGNLASFDRSDRDSVNEWKNFFDKFGSHVVVLGYGGGRLHGSIVGSNVRRALATPSTIDDTLNALVKFTNFPVSDLGSPSYRFFGGQVDEQSDKLYDLPEAERQKLIKDWIQSLSTEFIMLNNELRLEPISKIVKLKVSMEKGEMIKNATSLLLRGELEYSRRRSPGISTASQNAGGNSGGSRRSPSHTPLQGQNNPASPSSNTRPPSQEPAWNYPVTPYPGSSVGQRPPINNHAGSDNTNVPMKDITQGLLSTQIQQTNVVINTIRETAEQRFQQNSRRREQEEKNMNRYFNSWMETAKEKSVRDLQKIEEENQRIKQYYGQGVQNIEDQIKMDEMRTKQLLEQSKLEEENREKEHQLLLDRLEREKKEAEENANQCRWYEKIWCRS